MRSSIKKEAGQPNVVRLNGLCLAFPPRKAYFNTSGINSPGFLRRVRDVKMPEPCKIFALLNCSSYAVSSMQYRASCGLSQRLSSMTKGSTRSSKTNKPALQVPDPPLDTPALDDVDLCYSYEIARGEMGVLSFEPYKSLILPYWAFRTVPIAQSSAEVLWVIFESFVQRRDFVGADMTRKFIQMGMTRAKRYANHKGGR